MGRGFLVDLVSSTEIPHTVLVFAIGSAISPIRSLIESYFSANKSKDARLYYGARNFQRMAYQDRFKNWEFSGVKIIPVLSQTNNSWKGERGYVQAVFSRAKQILDASSTAAILCGHKAMTQRPTHDMSGIDYHLGESSEPKKEALTKRGDDNNMNLKFSFYKDKVPEGAVNLMPKSRLSSYLLSALFFFLAAVDLTGATF